MRKQRLDGPVSARTQLPVRPCAALFFVMVLTAQTGHVTPFTGTWKMNVSESKFNPGPPFKSFTLTFTPDGVRHLDLIAPDGHPVKVTLPWSDGKEVTPEAMPNTLTISKIRGRTLRDVWKQDGKVIEDVHGSVSPDGKSLKMIVDGKNAEGRRYHNEVIFDRN